MAQNDHQMIAELMVRYGRAIDARDYKALMRCFTPDAVVRYSSKFTKELKGHDELEAYLRATITQLDATHHMFMNFIVETDGDTGTFICAVQAQHIINGAPGGPILTIGGDYLNKAVRTPEGWKMSLLDFKPIWTTGNTALVDHQPVIRAA